MRLFESVTHKDESVAFIGIINVKWNHISEESVEFIGIRCVKWNYISGESVAFI